MVYISKKRGIKDFFKTRNMKYYIAFMILFLAVIATIIIINKRIKPGNDEPDQIPGNTESVTEPYDEPVTSAKGLYRININLATHMITAYAYDESDGSYSKEPGRCMIAGIGSMTNGSYKGDNGVKIAWFESDGGYYRYYSDYGSGIIFHSALYDVSNDKNSLNTADYNTIGTDTDTSGITLQVADAKWIYENCSYQSEFVIYSDPDEANDYEYLKKTNIPEGITWDPTDTTEENSVWCPTEIKLLDCDSSIEVSQGDGINDIFKHVNARDKDNASVISYVYITGRYDLNKAGEYEITLNLADTSGNHLTKAVTLIVKESETESETPTPRATKPSPSISEDKTTPAAPENPTKTEPAADDSTTTEVQTTAGDEQPSTTEHTEEITTSEEDVSTISEQE